MTGKRRPRILIYRETTFDRVSLSQIADDAYCTAVQRDPSHTLLESVRAQSEVPDLVIVPIDSPSSPLYSEVRKLRECSEFDVPIIGICPLEKSWLDTWSLRTLGVVGLIDKLSAPEQVRYKINQFLWCHYTGRQFRRAPCHFPVDVQANGSVTTEFARNLSTSGMSLVSDRPFGVDSAVRLWFRLRSSESPIEVRARVIQERPTGGNLPQYEVGVSFFDLPNAAPEELEREVESLLAEVEDW